MTTTLLPGGLVPVTDTVLFADAERLALVGFLAGYRGLTRRAYTMDLRLFTAWCSSHGLGLFAVRRVDIECYARNLEALGRARSTVARKLCTLAGFYRYAEVRHEALSTGRGERTRRRLVAAGRMKLEAASALEAQGRVASGLDDDRTGWNRQTVRAWLARRSGVRRRNQ